MPSAVVISVIVPVYGAVELLEELVSRTQASAEAIAGAAYEIILVDDCGPDAAGPTIRKCSARDDRIKGVRLARNVGQHLAIQAGLAHADGQWVVVMDCDLQDRPEDIVALWQTAQRGCFDQVVAVRHREGNWLARAGSVAFYQVLRGLTGHRHNPGVANFGLYRCWVIEAILAQRYARPFFPVQARIAGGATGQVRVEHMPRPDGGSSYSFAGRVRLAIRVLRSFGPMALLPIHHSPPYVVAEIISSCSNR